MILTVTLNPAVDHTLQLDDELTSDSVARTDTAQFDPGGKGINVSKYLVELDVETTATGYVGDFLGRFLREELTTQGIPNDFVEISGCTRLNTTILTPQSEFKINQNGPTVDDTALELIVETIERHSPEMVVVAGSLPRGVGPEAIDYIADAGPWETVVDVGGDVLADLEAEYALCKPNREELAATVGGEIDSLSDAFAAARALQKRGFERVVASLGGDGAIMATPDTVLYTPALDVDVVDTVGAGDALLAGVLAERQRSGTDEAALRAGVAVASRVVAVSGTSVPSLDDALSNIEEMTVTAH
ncbi:1-phosphofructokinase [Halogranum amylolyticum]|uniref:1-phosphofructokinase n=1 Tax=Halogranum amylolyticum TaxID=660520 RepID=A0A1H8TLK1_9EURY|nr:1-phosphofructokinase [Halogranum amylolyticum]SEO91358.1 1-phosphofructokinase [Halogranum amylolyticum]